MKFLLKYFFIALILSLPLVVTAQQTGSHVAPEKDPCAVLEKSIDNAASISGDGTDTENLKEFSHSIIERLPKFCTAGALIGFILNILFVLSGTIAVIFIMIGGVKLVMANGNSEAITAGKQTLTYAILGLIVIIMAATIVNVVLSLLADTSSTLPSGGTQNTSTSQQSNGGYGGQAAVNGGSNQTLTKEQAINLISVNVSTGEDFSSGKPVMSYEVYGPKPAVDAICGSVTKRIVLQLNGSSVGGYNAFLTDQGSEYSVSGTLSLEGYNSPVAYNMILCNTSVDSSNGMVF